MENKLPKLNSYVYIIAYVDGQPYCITKDKVYMNNNEAFITEDMLSSFVIDEYRHPRYLENYGYDWAHTLKEAKEVVKKYAYYNNLNYNIDKVSNNGWNVELCPKPEMLKTLEE